MSPNKINKKLTKINLLNLKISKKIKLTALTKNSEPSKCITYQSTNHKINLKKNLNYN